MLLQIQSVGARSSAFQALEIWHHNVPLKAPLKVILFTFIQLEMFLVFFARHGKNLYVAPNICLHMFGRTIRSVALFQLPSPRRQVDVSAISYSVT